MDTVSQEQPLSPRPPRSKRGRLSLACTQCRKRKVRCDATTPKCRNCVLRGDECETFDPRRPNGPAVRKWPHKSSQSTSTISPIQRRASIATASQQSSPASSIVGSQHAGNKDRNPSWIERAYQESQSTPDSGTDVHTNDSPDVVMNTDESSHRIKVSIQASSHSCILIELACSTWAPAAYNASPDSSIFSSSGAVLTQLADISDGECASQKNMPFH
jgi:hypothetical protein